MRPSRIESRRLYRQPYSRLRRLPVGAGRHSMPLILGDCESSRDSKTWDGGNMRDQQYRREFQQRLFSAMHRRWLHLPLERLPLHRVRKPPGKLLYPPRLKLAHPEVPRIPAKEVKQLIAKKADIVIVDTQPPDNYDMWHIPSAINIPYISTGNPTDRELMLIALPWTN